MRAAAWGVVAAGLMAPLVRKRVKAPPVLMQAVAFTAPLGLCVAVRRSRARDVAACALQMWAYVAEYETPHDDAERQLQRVHIRYPIVIDRALGLGELPTVRLQRALARGGTEAPEWRALDGVLVWAHWVWFLVPHSALAYILLRRPERFPRAAVMTYTVFDLGACAYWVLPTAPPWFAASVSAGGVPAIAGAEASTADGASAGAPPAPGAPRASEVAAAAGREPRGAAMTDEADSSLRRASREMNAALVVRRMMVEYGESFWEEGWGPLFRALGGNPLAAMPSLHVATSAMAALQLGEVGPVEGALAWTYATVLAFALVYLGEHYVIDLLGGLALTGAVQRLAPDAAPTVQRLGELVARLEAYAHEER
jgi:PAP2 superfamily